MSGSAVHLAVAKIPLGGDTGARYHDLIDQLGFDPVDAGPISESWRQQPGTPVYGKDLNAENTRTALTEASPERTSEWSARTA